MTMNTPSRVSSLPFYYQKYDFNENVCDNVTDFKELLDSEKEFKIRLNTGNVMDDTPNMIQSKPTTILLSDVKKLDIDVRENLICKIKKICDTFELSDEVFYTSVLLNDLQMITKETRRYKEK